MEFRAKPFKSNVLVRLKRHLKIEQIVDVGVNKGTPELVSAFPSALHHLFEPMPVFYEAIENNYSTTPHVLYKCALSNEDGFLYLVGSSIANDGVITHSQISSGPVEVDGKRIVDCSQLEVKRYDSLGLKVGRDFLVKVDVDGKDLEVLKGFGEELTKAAVIIVEATFSTLSERMVYCLSKGFQLWDVVDLVYYGDALYQCDLVFVRKDLANQGMRSKIKDFDKRLWSPFKEPKLV